MTADHKYSSHNMENFPQQIQMILSQKSKTFSEFPIAFLKSTSYSEYFETKMSLIAYVFLKLVPPKEVLNV